MRTVELRARSLAEDAALVALADIASVLDDWNDARVVGGHMVHIHTLLAGTPPRPRRTADTALAGTLAVISSDRLAARLLGEGLGYDRRDGSRIGRRLSDGHEALIDLMVPSRTSAARHNVRAGAFVVDAFPGLQTAMRRAPELVDVRAIPTDGAPRAPFVVAVPDLIGALVVKSLAAHTSGRDRDRDDVEDLLRCAVATGVRLPDATPANLDYEKVAAYLHGAFLVGRPDATPRRRLVRQVVTYDPRPDPFPNL